MRFRSFPVGIYFNMLLFLAVVLLSGGGMYMFRDILLRNARSTGMTLAGNYAAEEQSRLTAFSTLLAFGAASVDKRLQEGDIPFMAEGLAMFFDRVQTVVGEDRVTPYIIVNGMTIDREGRIKDLPESLAREREWYRLAMAHPEETVFTNLYVDVVTGEPVITVARRCRTSDAVIFFDIFSQNFSFKALPEIMTHRDSFFLCDGNGAILYSHTALSADDDVVQDYVTNLFHKVKAGDFDDYRAHIIDLDGEKRAVYYARLFNGWYTIFTMPYAEILQKADVLFYFLAAFSGIFFLFLAVYSWRFVRANALVESTNETVRVLGNSYYALYRVDFGSNSYEMIKGSDYVRRRLPEAGDYDGLLQVITEVIEPEAREEFMRNFSAGSIRSLVARRVRDFGGDFRRLFGEEYRWVSVHVLFDESLSPEEAVICFREVEQEKQRQLQERRLLQESLENSQQSEKAKQAFFSNMSHDMRTPINAIIGMSDLARKFLDDRDKVRSCLDRINFSSLQLKNLIDDVLNMSRMEQGKFALNNRELDLEKCVRDCLDAYAVQAEMEHKTLRVQLDVKNPHVVGDSVRIVQLLNNLVSNAFKFTSADDVITVSVTQVEKRESEDFAKYVFVVSDTGTGISKEFLPHLFEPYMRETRFSARNVAGTGLGMSITKSLVEHMNGEIRVESTLGTGSTFTVVLPFAAARKTGESAAAEQGPDMEVLKGRHILLAEDNMVNMELAVEMLSMNGMEVSQAWNGREAVELFAASEPFFFHAVLMDMQMPEMDGCEAARRIRAMNRPDAGRVPIIAVTANAFAEDIVSTKAAGMDVHVSKPIDFKYLFQVLEKFLKKD